MLVKEELRKYKVKLREVVSAGEPLNPEVVRQVEHSWGITIRDGYGQTETTAIIGNTPGQKVKAARWADLCPVIELRSSTFTGNLCAKASYVLIVRMHWV